MGVPTNSYGHTKKVDTYFADIFTLYTIYHCLHGKDLIVQSLYVHLKDRKAG